MIRVRRHGTRGPLLFALHGGPGAPGDVAPLARALADEFRVLEPLQRKSGGTPLTVSLHIEDLAEVVEREGTGDPPILIGHSWGAMLALAYAVEHPVNRLLLIGCGTFDEVARAELTRRREARCPELRELQVRLRTATDPAEKGRVLRRLGALVEATDVFDALDASSGETGFDERGHFETWADMMRLQREGVYPARFSRIEAPVVMLHGEQDPHPGRLIREGLRALLPQLQFVEFPRCGHTPWIERHACESFLTELRERIG